MKKAPVSRRETARNFSIFQFRSRRTFSRCLDAYNFRRLQTWKLRARSGGWERSNVRLSKSFEITRLGWQTKRRKKEKKCSSSWELIILSIPTLKLRRRWYNSTFYYPYSTLCCRNVAETLLDIAMLPFVTGCIAMLLQHCGNIAVEYCIGHVCAMFLDYCAHIAVQYCNGHVCAMFREYCAHNTRGILRTYCGTILPEYFAHIAMEYCPHCAQRRSCNIRTEYGFTRNVPEMRRRGIQS